jgi:hypothetical protein
MCLSNGCVRILGACLSLLVGTMGDTGFGYGHSVVHVLVKFSLSFCNPLLRGGCVTAFTHMIFGRAKEGVGCVSDYFRVVVEECKRC